MSIRDELRRLIEVIPHHQALLAKRLLEALIETDQDDEDLTPEELRDVERARAKIARGEYVDWEDLKKELRELDDHDV